MRKGSKLYSIFRNKCPRCQEGQFFESNNPYNLKTFTRMHNECQLCQENFEPETGFYYGAMYVSYGLGAMVFVAVWVAISVLFPGMDMIHISLYVVTALLLCFPLMFRLARLIWINIFVKFDSSESKKLSND